MTPVAYAGPAAEHREGGRHDRRDRSAPLGNRRGYIPNWSHGPEPELVSHEAINILNETDDEAHVTLTLYFADREPVGPYRLTLASRRTLHQRTNDLEDPEPVPRGKGYACVIQSDVPVVQQTRLDSRQADNGLFSTLAHAG